ncbi:MAG: GlsB/YeaQ/YmgE family stress response membrane protein, partial [Pseudolabrys sp.]
PRRILNQEKFMGVIAWIIIGLIAGWLATQILGGRGGLLYNLAVGLVGALVGGFLFEKLRLEVVPDFWGNLITATIGAVIFLLIWRAIRRA